MSLVATLCAVGLRAAFKMYRQLLGEKLTCNDITEQDWEASRKAAVATGFRHTGAEEEEGAEEEVLEQVEAVEAEEGEVVVEAPGRLAPQPR